MQHACQPVTHEHEKPVARHIAARLHQLIEMPVRGVTAMRLGFQPDGVTRGQWHVQKTRNFRADRFRDGRWHEQRVAFHARRQRQTPRAKLGAETFHNIRIGVHADGAFGELSGQKKAARFAPRG